jgi:hypothetical protein
MKRAGKCAGKRKYAYKNLAVDVARWKYVNQGIVLGVYECPTCLDFHLTSKYCNLKNKHERWEKEKHLWTKSFESIRKEQRKLKNNKNKKKILPSQPLSKKQQYKQSVVPADIVCQKLAELDQNRYPQSKSLWSGILDIIIHRRR